MTTDPLLQRIRAHYDSLNTIGRTADGGFTRLAFSQEESAAHDYFSQQAHLLGLIEKRDDIGNRYFLTPWSCEKHVLIGSHLDTVRNGGNYDGVVGVLAGFEAIRLLLENPPAHPTLNFGLVIWRGEESAPFGRPTLGSTCALLGLRAEDLKRSDGARTLADALRKEIGPNAVEVVLGETPCLQQQERQKISGFLEIHIEQSTVLETQKVPIGIVTSIRGPIRYSATLHRNSSEPEGKPTLAFARILHTLSHSLSRILLPHEDLLLTCGVASTEKASPHSPLRSCGGTTISGYSELHWEGSPFPEECEYIFSNVCEEFGVQWQYLSTTPSHSSMAFMGRFDHSGATPMGINYRKDANLAASAAILRIMEKFPEAPLILNAPNDKTSVSFLLEFRGNDKSVRDKHVETLLLEANTIAIQSGCQLNIELMADIDPIPSLSPDLQNRIQSACRDLKISHCSLPSGALHDAATVAMAQIPSALIFIPCREGLSHNPKEHANNEDIAIGIRVLHQVLGTMAIQEPSFTEREVFA
ncbi:MAG: M20/M25/M40 family metallo-hydrolase [Bdellovibrionales bacterium]|nr:M20/M25/M40 family metallo-hydrolase [Bdellovibrionales bacterium]